jgi:cation transport ATPase
LVTFRQLSGVFVPAVVVLALLTFFIWFGLASSG